MFWSTGSSSAEPPAYRRAVRLLRPLLAVMGQAGTAWPWLCRSTIARVAIAELEQLLVVAELDDPPALQHRDLLRASHR